MNDIYRKYVNKTPVRPGHSAIWPHLSDIFLGLDKELNKDQGIN